MPDYDKLFIGGTWTAPSGSSVIEVRSPASLEVVGRVPEAVEADVDAAVDAARRAFDEGPWPTTSPAERAGILTRLSAILRERGSEMSALISSELGQPPMMIEMMQNGVSNIVLDYYAGLAETFPWEET